MTECSYLVCAPDGRWVQVSECTDIHQASDNVIYIKPTTVATWAGAMELAPQYNIRSIVGQLPAISSEVENKFIVSMAKFETVWIGGSRDELNISNGVYWASDGLRGKKIFDGYVGNGGPVDNVTYLNFASSHPANVGSAIAISSGPSGEW